MSGDPTVFEIYKLYLATAEKVSDRRGAANQWLLSVNGAVVALYGYLAAGKDIVSEAESAVWAWAIPLSGVLVCLAWAALLASYSALNGAKFRVIQELEAGFPHQPFTRESAHYRSKNRISFARLEALIPWGFGLLHAIILLGALI